MIDHVGKIQNIIAYSKHNQTNGLGPLLKSPFKRILDKKIRTIRKQKNKGDKESPSS